MKYIKRCITCSLWFSKFMKKTQKWLDNNLKSGIQARFTFVRVGHDF